MRVLLDECVDQRLRNHFPKHDVQSAQYAGLVGLKNGDLLNASESVSFIGFVVFLLIVTWNLGYRAHEQIRMLFMAKKIEQVERGSVLGTVLDTTSNTLLGGLFAAFLLAGFCLGALGQALSSH
jgi:hypothetical protein